VKPVEGGWVGVGLRDVVGVCKVCTSKVTPPPARVSPASPARPNTNARRELPLLLCCGLSGGSGESGEDIVRGNGDWFSQVTEGD
jgi:hypothetical protein